MPRVTALALALCGSLVPAGNAWASCYAPEWRRLSFPTLGFSTEMGSEAHVEYRIDPENFLNVDGMERARPGEELGGRCGDMTFNVTDLGSMEIGDADGLLRARASEMLRGGLNDMKVLANRSLTFQGFPAREVSFSFTIDYFGTPATHRYLLVARGNRYYVFGWVWGDDGPPPADVTRMMNSIRFTPPTADPNARSRAMLQETILLYWMREEYPEETWFDAGLRAIADPKRTAESAMIKAYGYPLEVEFRGVENGYRIFRIEHSYALVDWYIADNGSQISGITWRKIRDLS